MSKRLMLLGGSRYLVPVIDAAHDLGAEVITCDYLPKNYAHAYSDAYSNVSIVDKDAVLREASRLGIDGIMSFAADPGVVTAAYVAEKLSLPFQASFDVACILQKKDRFREFLRNNGFNCPEAFTYGSLAECVKDADSLPYPVIVKPVDSAGSKGVTRVDDAVEMRAAAERAFSHSIGGRIIVEQFIEKAAPSSDSDCFTVDGRFECVSFTSQLFDPSAPNPYAPSAYCMPSAIGTLAGEEISLELQRLSDLLGLRTGIYNVESRVGKDGKPYLMEVSPRGGGNRLAEMLRLASGVDLVEASVRAALGEPMREDAFRSREDGYWYQAILHSLVDGLFEGIEYSDGFYENHVMDEALWAIPGQRVSAFRDASDAFGSLMMRFDSAEELEGFLANSQDYVRVIVG